MRLQSYLTARVLSNPTRRREYDCVKEYLFSSNRVKNLQRIKSVAIHLIQRARRHEIKRKRKRIRIGDSLF